MNHALTHIAGPDYSLPIADASAIGFDRPTGQNNGAQAPSNSLGVFLVLCLGDSPLVVCEGNPSGLPVQAVGVRRSVNPSHAATILFDRIWCQLVLNQTQDTNMSDKFTAFVPEDCFTLAANVDQTKLYDPIYLFLERARALLALLQTDGQDLAEGFTVPHSVVMFNLDGIDASLSQVKTLLETQHNAQFDALQKAGEAA